MYYEHFGLTQAPFKITPEHRFLLQRRQPRPVLEALIYAITPRRRHRQGHRRSRQRQDDAVQHAAEPPADDVESVYLANPSVAPRRILHAIAFELQLADRRATPTASK